MPYHRELLANGRLDYPAGRKCVKRKGLQIVNAARFFRACPDKSAIRIA
jgi:hypothetical protein